MGYTQIQGAFLQTFVLCASHLGAIYKNNQKYKFCVYNRESQVVIQWSQMYEPDKYFYLEAKALWTGEVYSRLFVPMGLHPWNQPVADQNYSERFQF